MGIIPRDYWRVMLAHGEMVAMQAAQRCARRGDAQSLTALCREMIDSGPWPLLNRPDDFSVSDFMVDYEKISDDVWTHPKKRRMTLPVVFVQWNNVALEAFVAVCLSRPVDADGVVQQPRTKLEDLADTHNGHVPPYKATLSPAQRELLDAAVTLFKGVPATKGNSLDGIDRLMFQLCRKVAWPGLGHALAEADIDLVQRIEAQEGHLLIEALRQHNPVSVISLIEACDRREPLHGWRSQILEGFQGRRSAMAELLVAEKGESGVLADPRWQAASVLVRHACSFGMAWEKVSHCMALVKAHLGRLNAQSHGLEDFSEAVLTMLMKPLGDMQPEPLASALKEWQARMPHEPKAMMRDVVGCAPVLRVLSPVLAQFMAAPSFDSPLDAWERFADENLWDRDAGLERWRQCLQVLVDAGLDPCARIACAASPDDDRGSTTLLHLVASHRSHRASSNVIERMAMLLEMGADPAATDADCQTPYGMLEDEELQQRWDSIVRSHQARQAARQAVDEIGMVPGARR